MSRKGSAARSRPKGEQCAKGRKDEGGGRRVEGREVGLERGRRDKERVRERKRIPRASSGWLPSSALCGKWPLNNA